MTRKAIALEICLWFMVLPAAAQVRAEKAVVRPVRIEEPPQIDGLLDEPLWQKIKPITDFRQYEPNNGEPATERTEVRIGYDSHFLYFGVRAFDGEPDKIICGGDCLENLKKHAGLGPGSIEDLLKKTVNDALGESRSESEQEHSLLADLVKQAHED